MEKREWGVCELERKKKERTMENGRKGETDKGL